MDNQNLITILIQTGFNIERIFQDKAIKKEAYTVLKYRNELAIAELKEREGKESSNDNRNCNKPYVNGSGDKRSLGFREMNLKFYTMNFKRCNDSECELKNNCLRTKFRSGDFAQIKHGVDEDGNHYCNYFLTEEGRNKILKNVNEL